MNYRLQLSPNLPKPQSHLGFDLRRSKTRWENARFFRSWLVYDSDFESSRSSGSLNWNVIAGLLVTATVSACGWYGISLLLRHFLK